VSESTSGGARRRARDRAAGVLADDGAWIELDDVTAQERSGSVTVPWRREWARRAGIQQGTALQPFVDPYSGAMLFVPEGVSPSEVFADA
jgi:hypothetical protein